MKKATALIAVLILAFSSFSQLPIHRLNGIPVKDETKTYQLAWTGGVNSAEFSSCDLNGDSQKDLFVFDRSTNRILTFIYKGGDADTAYEYAPQYEAMFPQNMVAWALLRDYNGDNIPDLFTHDTLGLGTRVFKGSLVQGQLHFDLVSPLLNYDDHRGNHPNIWTSITDIPVLADVNGDGDLDILSYSLFGTAIQYFENQTKENPGDIHFDVDSFKYIRITTCWGGFSQNSLTNSLVLHDPNCLGFQEGPTGFDNSRHNGNSLFPIDADNDGDIDLLNGNVGYNNLMFLHNCGSQAEADVCNYDSLFPTCNFAVTIPPYPAAFGIDVDVDSKQDLLVTPCAFANQGPDVNNVWYYHNEGNNGCQYKYVGDSFLVNRMLDFGSNSKPVFVDENGDGLLDIITGSQYYSISGAATSTLSLLKNTGTLNQPEYTLVSKDYDSLSRFHLAMVNPTFGDLDGDGHIDMLVGEQNGFVHFFRNTATVGLSFPVLTTPQYFLIKVNGASAPFIYDINGDSLPDILVGDSRGNISYYWNFGTKTNPLFSGDSSNTTFGNINVTPSESALGYAQPYVVKDTSGHMELFVGSSGGTIYVYRIDSNKLHSGTFAFLDSNYLHQNLGSNIALSIADINGDNLADILLGNGGGGLLMFSPFYWDINADINGIQEPEPFVRYLTVYPNPAKDYIICQPDDGAKFTKPVTEVYNVLGERMNIETTTGTEKLTISTGNLNSGFYLLRITDGNRSYVGKILLEK